jgi:hypothetical protein
MSKIDTSGYRVDFRDTAFSNRLWAMNASYYGVKSFYNQLTPQPYDQFLFSNLTNIPHLRAMMGARYVLCGLSNSPTDGDAKEILETDGYRLYENLKPMGRITLVHRVAGSADNEREFLNTIGKGFDDFSEAYVTPHDFESTLWIHDLVGETQAQYDPKRLSIMNRILAILPEKFRRNKINGQLTEVKRREPGQLCSPFEQIRSGEIVPVFERWFTIEWKREFDAFLNLVVPRGTRAAYLENEDTKALFEILMLFDRLCLEQKIVQPRGGQYLMRPKSVRDLPAKNTTTG